MSQICRYYLKGICKYGSRCHFLHENIDYNYKENYSGYSNAGYHGKYQATKNENFESKNLSSGNYYNRNSSSTYGGFPNDYNRYHVDNRRHNRTEISSIHDLSDQEILDIVRHELKEFEERHVWIFSVVAPLKELGNIPGLVDVSPEEIRLQYYESIRNNCLPDFCQKVEIARSNVAQICQMFKTKSRECRDLVRNMRQRLVNKNGDEMVTEYHSNTAAASAFKFDLNSLAKLPTQPSSANQVQCLQMPTNASNFSSAGFSPSLSTSNPVVEQSLITTCQPTTENKYVHPQSSSFNFFSFNLNKLQGSRSTLTSAPTDTMESKFGVTDNSNFVTCQSAHNNGNDSFYVNDTFSEEPARINSNFNQQKPAFGLNVVPSAEISNSIYSQSTDDLSIDDMAAFQAKTFKIGQIPLVPPLRELCFN